MAQLSACAKKLPSWFQPSTYFNQTKIALWRHRFISTSRGTITLEIKKLYCLKNYKLNDKFLPPG